MKTKQRIFALTLASIVLPFTLQAQDSPATTPTAAKSAADDKVPDAKHFRGPVTAVDTKASTLSMQAKKVRTFKISETTVLTKGGSTITLADIKVGDEVLGAFTGKGKDANVLSVQVSDASAGAPKTEAPGPNQAKP